MPETLLPPAPVSPTQRRSIVRLEGVSKHFGKVEVLKSIDLDVVEGEVLVLIGPSGSGKSTLLRCINQLETPDDGLIYVDDSPNGYALRNGALHELSDRDTARQRSRTGMVFQNFNLFPRLTALENVAIGPIRVLKKSRAQAEAKGRELLESVGLKEMEDRFPAQLSGGQQQRVAIARAMAMEPSVLLLDEPTSALDPELVSEVLDIIRSVAHTGTTMVVVTHEIAFAAEVADRVAFMDGGALVHVGTPAEVLTDTSNPRIRRFLTRVNGA